MTFPGSSSPQRNGPIIQSEVEERILEIVAQLEDETETYESLCEKKVDAEVEYKQKSWNAYLQAEGAVKVRESLAGYQTTEEYRKFLRAEALAKAKKEKLHTLRSALDALRTISANVRAQT